MANPESDYIKDMKTATVSLVALGLTKAAIGSGDVGTIISVVLMLPLINYMHSKGEERRIGSNLINGVQQAVSSSATANRLMIYNAYRNISNGGAKIFDDVVGLFGQGAQEAQEMIRERQMQQEQQQQRQYQQHSRQNTQTREVDPIGALQQFGSKVNAAIDKDKIKSAANTFGQQLKGEFDEMQRQSRTNDRRIW